MWIICAIFTMCFPVCALYLYVMNVHRKLQIYLKSINIFLNKGWINWEYKSKGRLNYLHLCVSYPRKYNPEGSWLEIKK